MSSRRNYSPADRKPTRLVKRALLAIIAASLLISCVRLVWRAWKVESLIETEQLKLDELQQVKTSLEEKIEVATSSFELERRAREELLLQASDESVWQRE